MIPEEPYVPEVSAKVAAIVDRVVSQRDQRALQELKPLADAGDESAMALIGEINMGGLFGQAVNPAVGCDYFARIQSGRPDGLHNMGNCYEFGAGRPKDLVRARAFYRRAAEGGFRQSICAYGTMLVTGQGGPADIAEGMRLCRLSAVAGDANAQTDYGGYLLTGVGGERNPEAARFMFEQAVQQKQRNAAFLLAKIYQRGDGIEASDERALQWFAKSYEWGRLDAAQEVGLIHVRRGYLQQDGETIVVAPELENAVRWLEISAQVHPDAARRDQARALIADLNVLISAAQEAESAN